MEVAFDLTSTYTGKMQNLPEPLSCLRHRTRYPTKGTTRGLGSRYCSKSQQKPGSNSRVEQFGEDKRFGAEGVYRAFGFRGSLKLGAGN